jgi:hypothetical protein
MYVRLASRQLVARQKRNIDKELTFDKFSLTNLSHVTRQVSCLDAWEWIESSEIAGEDVNVIWGVLRTWTVCSEFQVWGRWHMRRRAKLWIQPEG